MSKSETLTLEADPGIKSPSVCLCGIQNCEGHEVVDGCAIFYDHPDAPARVARVRLWQPEEDSIT